MSRSGLIALIIIAVLTVAGGVYWYLEFVPLADQGAKGSAGAVQEPVVETTVAETAAPAIVIEAIEESPADPPPSSEEPGVEEDTPALHEQEPILAPQSHDEESTGDEVEVTIIPFSELEDLFGSGLFALADPFPIDLSPLAPEQKEDVEPEVESPVLTEPDLIEEPIIEEPAVGQAVFAEPVPPPVVEQLPAPPVPTPRVESESKDNEWLVGAKISIAHLDLPSFGTTGFGLEVDFMRHHRGLFSWGASLVVAKQAENWNLDLLANARWTPAVGEKLSFPLTLSLGPSVRVSPTVDIAVAVRAQGGISYALTQNLSLFYEAGIGARYGMKQGFTAGLEPVKIGFSYAF